MLSEADLEPLDAIANLPRFNGGGAFTDLPLILEDPDNPVVDSDDNFVRYNNITVSQVDELEFTVVSNSNPDLVDVTVDDGQLVLDYAPDRSGTAEIVIQATDLLGDSVEDSFLVTVEESVNPAQSVFGTLEADVLEIEGSNNLVFAREGDDLLNASLSEGENLISGNSGDDTFILGQGDRALGRLGNDRFFVTNGGDNTITGGKGADQFWIAVANIPETTNTITDFTSGEDLIGISGLGIGFDDLSLTQDGDNTLISTNGSDLVVLLGIESGSLSADDFAVV